MQEWDDNSVFKKSLRVAAEKVETKENYPPPKKKNIYGGFSTQETRQGIMSSQQACTTL